MKQLLFSLLFAVAFTNVFSQSSCTSTSGTLVGASYSAIAGACGSSNNDVWYKFIAQAASTTISITGAVANPRFQIYNNNCGSLGSIYCSSAASGTATTLVIGTVYLVRIYSTTNNLTTFNICVQHAAQST